MSEDEELNRSTNREAKVKWGTRETMNTSNSKLYSKVAISSRKGCDLGGIW